MFSPGGRDQYWFEGMVVALLYVGMSLAILGVYTLAGWKRCGSERASRPDVPLLTLLELDFNFCTEFSVQNYYFEFEKGYVYCAC